MRILKKYSYILMCCLLAAFVATGCSDAIAVDETPEPEEGGMYLMLNLSVSRGTRSNPSGGETGDGEEGGVRRENEIENLALFFYDHEKGPDAPDDTPLLHYEMYEGLSLTPGENNTVSHVVRVPQYGMKDGHRAIVVANFTGDPSASKTLGELRKSIVTAPWRASASVKDYSRFTMATASGESPYDGRINFFDALNRPIEGTREDPFYMMAEVERVAARIDLMFDGINIEGTDTDKGELCYNVTSGTAAGDHGVLYVSHVLPVNSMKDGTSLLKHVTTGVDDMESLVVCGDELTDELKKIPINYVVEPNTLSKSTATGTDLSSWYGNTSAEYIRNNPDAIFTEASHIGNWLSVSGLVTDCSDGFDKTMTLAYVNENTQHMSLHDSRFITGLVIRGIFVPSKVLKDMDGNVDESYVKGTSFWRYSPTSSEMSHTNLYFNSKETAERYAILHPDDIAVISEYKDGVCYYNLWLRHANIERDDEAYESFPMEYGIVRNNIYRVGVSFTGIGSPLPDIREPLNIRTRIFVRKWNFRRQPTIIM